ncbi:MAG: RNA polymerase sigma factor [bacterium]
MTTAPELLQQLVRQAKAGDEHAFISLYHHFLPMVFGYCYQRIGHQQQAEDVVAEIFLGAVKGLKSFDGDSSFKTWLFSIAKFKLADFWRKHDVIDFLDEERFPDCASEEECQEDEQDLLAPLRKVMQTIINKLPEQYRKVVQLRFVEQYSLAEVAERMGITLANVKVLQHRAVKKCIEIRKELSNDGQKA